LGRTAAQTGPQQEDLAWLPRTHVRMQRLQLLKTHQPLLHHDAPLAPSCPILSVGGDGFACLSSSAHAQTSIGGVVVASGSSVRLIKSKISQCRRPGGGEQQTSAPATFTSATSSHAPVQDFHVVPFCKVIFMSFERRFAMSYIRAGGVRARVSRLRCRLSVTRMCAPYPPYIAYIHNSLRGNTASHCIVIK
jgi:hypothetical protein